MLGSGINPESFKQDYSGFANAAATQAQGIADLGASIGGAIREFGKASEERKKIDAETKASRAGIESVESKAPDLIPGIGELRMTLENQEIPLSQRITAAESLFSVMDTGFKVNQMIYQNKAMNMSMDQSSAARSAAADTGRGLRLQ